MKQYVIKYEVYSGNDEVSQYIDGKFERTKIMNNYNTQGYCICLENEGYKRAYDVDEAFAEMLKAKEEILKAQEAYDYAVDAYEYAKKNALIKK